MSYFFYILRCSDNSLYCGITTDLARRVAEHNEKKGISSAKYTRSRRPVRLVYSEEYESMAEAMKREREVKRMKKEEKEKLVIQLNNIMDWKMNYLSEI